ncbi:MAG: fumarylacetoacetate hydrolase family protein, partial [Planctomycetes bacterium]|nr:fumarylacetoacetate hydrolase family protein [Planctomycetota bacterium]
MFTKNPASACLDGDDIVIPAPCRDEATGGEQVDFEAELAVVIGVAAKD